jgi:hypothetical protein
MDEEDLIPASACDLFDRECRPGILNPVSMIDQSISSKLESDHTCFMDQCEVNDIQTSPVTNKTECVIADDNSSINEEFVAACQGRVTATVMLDGMCCAIISTDQGIFLCRRYDIRNGSRNIGSLTTGIIGTVADRPCWITKIRRGCGREERLCDAYFFDLDADGMPNVKHHHSSICFTPLDAKFEDDLVMMNCFVMDTSNTSNTFNNGVDCELWATRFDKSSIDIVVQPQLMSAIMGRQKLVTVELMLPNICNHYGFTSNTKHFVSLHGSITFPLCTLPAQSSPHMISVKEYKKWFKSYYEDPWQNRWAGVKGIVYYCRSTDGTTRRFKVGCESMGFDLEMRWLKCKKSGLSFVFKE